MKTRCFLGKIRLRLGQHVDRHLLVALSISISLDFLLSHTSSQYSPMVLSQKNVRKMVVLSLIGLGIVSGVSVVLSSGVEAQDQESQPERWVQSSAKESAYDGSVHEIMYVPDALIRMGKDLVPMVEVVASGPSTMPPEVLTEALRADVNSPERALDSSLTSKPSERASGMGAKTIAIDAELDNGEAPAITNVDRVQFAAQMWSNASFPVEQFQAYTSPFGYRSSPTGGYRQEFHYGLDIAAPQQSYIRNWWAGTVIEVSDGGSCGTSVVIQSGEWTHMYCHMQGHVEISGGVRSLIDRDGGIQLWEGQQIIAGDRIGRVGMTGRTTGPHLHWGLKYQGNWVDPAWVLQAMSASYQALYGQN